MWHWSLVELYNIIIFSNRLVKYRPPCFGYPDRMSFFIKLKWNCPFKFNSPLRICHIVAKAALRCVLITDGDFVFWRAGFIAHYMTESIFRFLAFAHSSRINFRWLSNHILFQTPFKNYFHTAFAWFWALTCKSRYRTTWYIFDTLPSSVRTFSSCFIQKEKVMKFCRTSYTRGAESILYWKVDRGQFFNSKNVSTLVACPPFMKMMVILWVKLPNWFWF